MDKVISLTIVMVVEFLFMLAGVELYKADWWEMWRIILAMLALNGILVLFIGVVTYLNGDAKTVTKD
jgi:purine-cytosine permease-like protein